MKCGHCHRDYPRSRRHCPHCATPNPAAGFFQTSAVMIAERGAQRVYHSVEEVPARLRTRLERSTNSENSATILIADRRGHSEISKTFRSFPQAAQGRPSNWLNRSPARRKVVLAILFGLALALVAAVFTYRWK
jgi:hypothetical protein